MKSEELEEDIENSANIDVRKEQGLEFRVVNAGSGDSSEEKPTDERENPHVRRLKRKGEEDGHRSSKDVQVNSHIAWGFINWPQNIFDGLIRFLSQILV